MTTPEQAPIQSSEEERSFAAHILSLAKNHLALWAIDLALRLDIVAVLQAYPAGLRSVELAQKLSFDPKMTEALCRAAYTARLLEFEEERYRLAAGADVLLNSNSPLYARGLVGVAVGLREQLERLRKDIPARRQSWWDQIGPEFLEAVANTGRAFYTRLVELVLPQFPQIQERLHAGGRVLELGCGYGAGLVKMARAFPSATMVGIDGDAHSLAMAERNLAAAGVNDRVTLRQQTFETVDIEGGFDFAYINISLHEARDKSAVVANCFSALNLGGMLAVSEFPFSADQTSLRSDAGGFLSLIQLHEVYFGGHHLTVQQGQDLLKKAGFIDVDAIAVTPLQVVHHGTRPG